MTLQYQPVKYFKARFVKLGSRIVWAAERVVRPCHIFGRIKLLGYLSKVDGDCITNLVPVMYRSVP